jgi:hypothetical protein
MNINDCNRNISQLSLSRTRRAHVSMMRQSCLSAAASALRRISTRTSGGWAPPRQAETLAPSSPQAAATPDHHKTDIFPQRSKVVCRNWQQFGSCRYGQRCIFAEGHSDRAMQIPRSTGKRQVEVFESRLMARVSLSRCTIVQDVV